jgi:hypothetical protein
MIDYFYSEKKSNDTFSGIRNPVVSKTGIFINNTKYTLSPLRNLRLMEWLKW